jgi:hypothetical protein
VSLIPEPRGGIRFGIDGGVQPESFAINLDHSLVNRDVIRADTIEQL